MQSIQNITLDVNNSIEYKYINAKQGDSNSRFLKITLTENGKKLVPKSRCTASFRCLKPDGRICVNKSTINSDGTVTVKLTEQVLAAEGTVRADICLMDGSTVISTGTFFIQVEASPSAEGNVLSSDEFQLLIQKTNEATAVINSISQTVDTANEAYERVAEVEKTAGNALSKVQELEAYAGYTESDILGLCADYENKKFTRLAGAAGKSAGADFDSFEMYGGMKRCNVSDDGTINAFYGDDNYTDYDTNGQVMVYVPKFYYKVVPLKLEKNTQTGIGYHIRKANYYITDTPKAGFKLHPAFYDENGNAVDYFLYSAYEGVLYRAAAQTYYDDNTHTSTVLNDNDLICSLSSKKPISGQNLAVTRTLAEKYCHNRGAGWHCETIKALSALKLLMMIEFGTMNTQTALGKGIALIPYSDTLGINYSSITGSTRNQGNATGVASVTTSTGGGEVVNRSEDGMVAVSYRGIENPWGNIWRFIAGINVWGNGSMAGGQPYIAEDFNYNEVRHDDNYCPAGFTIANENGYIKAMGYGSEEYDWLLMLSETGGTSALPVGDYWYRSENINGHCVVRHGGAWNYGAMAGMFAGTSNTGASKSGNASGCRLIYIPAAE